MPDFHEIAVEIQGLANESASDAIRKKYTKQLFNITGRNVILYYSAWQQKCGNNLPVEINDLDMSGFMSVIHGLDKSKGVDLILHTPGGSLDATDAIGKYLKKVFDNDIRVIVPHLAMSGGMLLSFAAKEILMGSHSSLGPTDPLVFGLPAHGVVNEFNRAMNDVQNDPRTIEVWKHIIVKYSPALIGECQNAIAWSDEIATCWLKEGMFAEGDPLESGKIIENIVKEFWDHNKTKSHGRHFMIDQCRALELKVTPLEENETLQDAVLSVHHACIYALGGNNPNIIKMIENHLGKTHVMVMQIN